MSKFAASNSMGSGGLNMGNFGGAFKKKKQSIGGNGKKAASINQLQKMTTKRISKIQQLVDDDDSNDSSGSEDRGGKSGKHKSTKDINGGDGSAEDIIEEEDENSVSSGTSDGGGRTGPNKRDSKKKSLATGFEKKKTQRVSEIQNNLGG